MISELVLSRVGAACDAIRRDAASHLADTTESRMALCVMVHEESINGYWGVVKALERGHVLKKE